MMVMFAFSQTETQAEASSSQAPVALKLTLAAKEETLATLVEDNWLDRTEDGHVCLGTRSFLELRSFFKNFDVPFCEVCNEAAIKVFLIHDPLWFHFFKLLEQSLYEC